MRKNFIYFLLIVFSFGCLISACGGGNPNGKEEISSSDISSEAISSSSNDSFDKNSVLDEETATAEDSGIWTSVRLPE